MRSFLSDFNIQEVEDFLGSSIDELSLRVDHVCYKSSSHDEYEKLRKEIKAEGYSFLFESLISERDIGVIKVVKEKVLTLKSKLGDLQYIELQDQKPDNSQKSGFDHIEIWSAGYSGEELAAIFEKKGHKVFKKVRPHHTTYDLDRLPESGIIIRFCDEPMVEKVKREEM